MNRQIQNIGKSRTIASKPCRSMEENLGKKQGWISQFMGYKELKKVVDPLKTLKPIEIKKGPEIINVVRQPDAHHNKKSGNGH